MGRHPAPPCPAGALVRAAAAQKKLTHRAAAQMLGIDPGRLSRLLSGRALPTLREALEIHASLGVPPHAWHSPPARPA